MENSIIKTLYLYPKYNKVEKTGRMDRLRDDAIFYVIAGTDGSRKIRIKTKPDYTFYVANEKMGYHRLSCPIEKLTPITCEYDKRHTEMAKAVGLYDEWKNVKLDYKLKKQWINKVLYGHPQLYFADMDVEDVFKLNFNEKFGEHSSDIEYRTSFTDIEVRGDIGEWEQHVAEAPICSICHLDSATETIYAHILNDPKVPMIQEIFANLSSFVADMRTFLNEIRLEAVDKLVKDGGRADKVHSFNFKFKFILHDTEAGVIEGYFNTIKETSPDFVGIWNINYDMITIKNRAYKLGLNMADLISNNEVPKDFRYFEYVEDFERFNQHTQTHYSRFFDKVYSTSKTQWYCQMSLHSNLRKRFMESDYKLTTIGEKYAYVKKVDLENEGYSIKDVYSKNFRVFLKYALMDVIVQFMIERVNSDIPRYMVSCKDTRFSHGNKKTAGIKSELATFMKHEKGEIIGNNKLYDISESVEGAIIASPNNMTQKGISVMGIDTHIYRDCFDLDFKALYPSIMDTHNILKTTIYGRIFNIFIPKDIGGEDIQIPISHGSVFNKMLETVDTSIFDIGQKYFGLPRVDEIVSEIEKSCLKI